MTHQNIIDLIEEHKVEDVTSWLNSGGDPNIGRHPLILDVIDELYEVPEDQGLLNLLKLFLDKGAIINFPNEDYFIPLIEAIDAKSAKAVELLLNYNANANIIAYRNDYPKYTPLLLACENDYFNMVKLLAKRTNQEHMNLIGGYQVATALGHACLKLNLPIIEELLKNGANQYIFEWDWHQGNSIDLVPSSITSLQKKNLEKLVAEYSQHEEGKDCSG